MKEIIPVMHCFDNNYVIPAAVSFYSMLENANSDFYYKLYVLHSDITLENQNKLSKCIEKFDNASIEFIDMENKFFDLFAKMKSKSHYSPEMLYKMVAASLFTNYSKIIVTDVDVVFLSDISNEYNDFDVNEDFYLAGFKCFVLKGSFLENHHNLYKDKYSYEEMEKLKIGAGYLILNLDKIRNEKLEEKFINFAIDNAERLIQPEQDVLNLVAYPKIKYLKSNAVVCTYMYDVYKSEDDFHNDLNWDAKDIKYAMENPVQLHYATSVKPWKNIGCTKSDVWFSYLLKTNFFYEQMSKIEESKVNIESKAENLNSFHVENFSGWYFLFKYIPIVHVSHNIVVGEVFRVRFLNKFSLKRNPGLKGRVKEKIMKFCFKIKENLKKKFPLLLMVKRIIHKNIFKILKKEYVEPNYVINENKCIDPKTALLSTNNDYKCAVLCGVYNHEKHLDKTLEGFVKQKTSFPFKVYVADDASSDDSRNIISAYAAKYPDIIIPIFREYNLGVGKNYLDALQRIDTEYFAICDGDDYWIDEYKLQKQIDFLDSNGDFSIVCSSVKWHYIDTDKEDEIFDVKKYIPVEMQEKGYQDFRDFLYCRFIASCSCAMRWKLHGKVPSWLENHVVIDFPLLLIHSSYGKIKVLDNEVFAQYNIHDHGVSRNDATLEYKRKMFEILNHVDSFTEYAYHDIIKEFTAIAYPEFLEKSKAEPYKLCDSERNETNIIQIPTCCQKYVNLSIIGSNNTVVVEKLNYASKGSVNITIIGDNCNVILNKNISINSSISIVIGNDHKNFTSVKDVYVEIGTNTTFESMSLVTFNSGSVVTIGSNCMFANNVTLMHTDSHPIYNIDTNKIVNYVSEMRVGNNCWLGNHVTLLKNSVLPDNTIVGLGAIVTKSFDKQYTILAGNPAKIVKENIFWDSYSYEYANNARVALPHVLSLEETVQKIIDEKISIARFGDGEFRLIYGEGDLSFQLLTPEISQRLKEVLFAKSGKLLICLNKFVFSDLLSLRDFNKQWAVEYLKLNRHKIQSLLSPDKIYGSAEFTSAYIVNAKMNHGEHFSLLRKIWENRDIVIVQGNNITRTFRFNIYDNAKTVEYIEAPAQNAFRVYEQIFKEICCIDRSKLIVLVLGPTATILAHDLANEGYQALDLGHLAKDYDWYKQSVDPNSEEAVSTFYNVD